MDFKNILQKINLIEGIETKKVDLVVDIHGKTELPPEDRKVITLDESEAIKVLAGTRTLTEAVNLQEKKLTKAVKEKKEEVVKSMKKDEKGFKESYSKRGEEVMHAPATKIAKKKAEGTESKEKSLDEGGLDMNLIKAAQGGMSSVKKDPESERNKDKPYGYRSDKAVDDDKEDDEPKTKKRKTKKESIDPEQFRKKFLSLVEAKKKEAEKTVKGKKADEKMDEGKKSSKKKPDADGDGVPDWADKKPGEDDNAAKKTAGKKTAKGMTAKQAKYFGKKKTVKESNDIDEFFHYGKGGGFDDDDDYPNTGEGPEDLLDAVESEIKNPGQRIDNLVDVLNATFGSDKSPEFEKARRIIEKYIELVTTADMDHYDDDDDDRTNPAISAMDHDDIQRHIREYDLTDRLVHAAAMLEKIIAKGESIEMDEDGMTMADRVRRDGRGGDDGDDGSDSRKKNESRYGSRNKKLPESQRRSKRVVAESYQPKMTFREMMKLVVESGGQQQIDPLDKALFSWATRVAKNKLGEGMKAEVYAGLVYERMGGRFEMFDVLSESKKNR